MVDLAELAIRQALKLKATEAEAYVQRSTTTMIEFAEQIETFKTNESIGLGLRVAIGKRVATYSTSILDEKEAAQVAERAVKIARVTPEDPAWKHFNTDFGRTTVQGTYDSKIENIEHEEIVDRLLSSIRLIKERDARVKPTRGILALSTSTAGITNTEGQNAERKETGASVQLRAKINESGMESTGNEHQETRFWKELDLEKMAVSVADKAVNFLKAKPIPGGTTDIIFRNQLFAGLFALFIGPAVSADTVQKGRSPLADKLGKRIAAEDITITDDGTLRNGWATSSFDDEGHKTQKTPIIHKGSLKNFIYDTYTALKANTKSTGNAQRAGYWLKPQPSVSNLIFESGNQKPEEIIKDTRSGIYVDTTIGEWLSNPISGNLNATITHGYRLEKGELKQPVKGIVISGNFFDLLKTGISNIGNDVHNSAGDYAPTVKITGLTVAGE